MVHLTISIRWNPITNIKCYNAFWLSKACIMESYSLNCFCLSLCTCTQKQGLWNLWPFSCYLGAVSQKLNDRRMQRTKLNPSLSNIGFAGFFFSVEINKIIDYKKNRYYRNSPITYLESVYLSVGWVFSECCGSQIHWFAMLTTIMLFLFVHYALADYISDSVGICCSTRKNSGFCSFKCLHASSLSFSML